MFLNKTYQQRVLLYIVSRIIYLLGHLAARQTPCLPSGMGTASHGRYSCTQFIIRHHLLYSNLIPQHPVPLASRAPSGGPPRALPPVAASYSILKDCPLYSRKLFCFSTFSVDPRSETHSSLGSSKEVINRRCLSTVG